MYGFRNTHSCARNANTQGTGDPTVGSKGWRKLKEFGDTNADKRREELANNRIAGLGERGVYYMIL